MDLILFLSQSCVLNAETDSGSTKTANASPSPAAPGTKTMNASSVTTEETASSGRPKKTTASSSAHTPMSNSLEITAGSSATTACTSTLETKSAFHATLAVKSALIMIPAPTAMRSQIFSMTPTALLPFSPVHPSGLRPSGFMTTTPSWRDVSLSAQRLTPCFPIEMIWA